MFPKKFWNEFRLSAWSNEIFVGMWFDGDNIKKRYENIILQAINKTSLTPRFLKNILTGDSIPSDIMKGIVECKLVLFDISPMLDMKIQDNYIRNSNVMFELGLACTWRNAEEIIITRDDDGRLPTDIQHIGVLKYDTKNETQAIEEIHKTIVFRLNQVEKIQKSIVRKTAENLTIQAYNLLIQSKGKICHDANLKEIDKLLAIPLLLNLGLMEMLTDGKGYGYHPTQLGKEVILYGGGQLEEDDIENYKSLFQPEY